ncbi:hypothetical protein [Actinomadura sp. CNU-125]|uniref:hypothetical protein n=1 Tax=Actinomadura sp. CNU-125 TaxID=1904961 RepID=UPI000A632ECE|nr:hypothetical protein [Actinomadura sp. CNU-125]
MASDRHTDRASGEAAGVSPGGGKPKPARGRVKTALKDLASRAGRWLGLAAPPALASRAIEADRFDQMEWREVFDSAKALQDVAEALSEHHHYATDLLADVWTAAYKTAPRLREAAEVEPSRALNRQVAASLMSAPEFAELRRETAGDTHASALAVVSQRDRLTRLLEDAEEAHRAVQTAARIRETVAEAAQRVEWTLQEAASQTSEDGTVPEAAAQAVTEAIDGAQLAEQEAAEAEERSRMAMAHASPAIRTALRAAAVDAAERVRAEKALMAAWGVSPGQLQRMDFTARARLAERLRGGRLGRFADLIGRFRVMAGAERARKVEHAAGELVGITLGDDVSRLIPSELAALGVPALRASFAARLAENRLMIYETRGDDNPAKGAIVACVDCSGSMRRTGAESVTREAWAKACALALLDQARAARPRRDFAAILFSSEGQTAVFRFPAADPVDIADVIDLAERFYGGAPTIKPRWTPPPTSCRTGTQTPDTATATSSSSPTGNATSPKTGCAPGTNARRPLASECSASPSTTPPDPSWTPSPTTCESSPTSPIQGARGRCSISSDMDGTRRGAGTHDGSNPLPRSPRAVPPRGSAVSVYRGKHSRRAWGTRLLRFKNERFCSAFKAEELL